MLEGLNSNAWIVTAYLVVASIALLTGLREQFARRAAGNDVLLPWFWFLSSVLFVSMSIAHAGELGGAAADYARRGAHEDGWYEARRSAQAAAVGILASVWAIVTLLALWRIPERRRRYLPPTIAITTLLCYSAIRLISLHHVDTLLYRRNVQGAGVGVLVELSMLVVLALISLWARHRTRRLARLDDDVAAGASSAFVR